MWDIFYKNFIICGIHYCAFSDNVILKYTLILLTDKFVEGKKLSAGEIIENSKFLVKNFNSKPDILVNIDPF